MLAQDVAALIFYQLIDSSLDLPAYFGRRFPVRSLDQQRKRHRYIVYEDFYWQGNVNVIKQHKLSVSEQSGVNRAVVGDAIPDRLDHPGSEGHFLPLPAQSSQSLPGFRHVDLEQAVHVVLAKAKPAGIDRCQSRLREIYDFVIVRTHRKPAVRQSTRLVNSKPDLLDPGPPLHEVAAIFRSCLALALY